MSDELREIRRAMFGQNPFDDRVVREEIKRYGVMNLSPPNTPAGIEVKAVPLTGRCDDYLNVNMRIDESFVVPRLFIDGQLWMSLTPMEIQSQWYPICCASGIVGVAGLGMGYAALRMAEKEEVDRVFVFEDDERVIDFFVKTFKTRPGFKKITYVVGNARETIPACNTAFDWLYVDIYQDMLSDEAVSDIKLFSSCVAEWPTGYHFWGMERVLLDAVDHYEMISPADLTIGLRLFLSCWYEAPLVDDEKVTDMCSSRLGQEMHKSDLRRHVVGYDYCRSVLEALEMV